MDTVPGKLTADAEKQDGRAARYDDLYRAYLVRVFNYVRYRVFDPSVAEDVTADVFASAFESLDKYRPERGGIATWLFAIARRRVADHFRRSRKSTGTVPLSMAADEPAPDDVDSIVLQRLEMARVARAMALLKERQREVIALRIGAGLNSKDVGDQLRLKPGNVDVILHRALKRLGALMEERNS